MVSFVTTGTIEVRMLGPLEVLVDGVSVPLGGPKQRALVALLLLNANDVVPLDVLIDELWGGKPARTAPAYVQNCVSRLRKESGADTLETRAPVYRLRVEPDAIDARRFERLVREARPLPARERAAALREALELWRGTPLADLAYWSFTQDAIRNLQEQRVNALQMRLEAELELGQHREVIGELDLLVREHPTHERLRWLQMLALHRSDRRMDALAAYQEVRLAIVEESGMEPGEELRALQRRILQDDPTLMPGGVAVEVVERPPQLARKVVAVCIVELLIDDELDVEAARGLVSRGLASLEEIVLRHGGRVEQLLGEEALAVFGLPAAHEDDLLRALRAVIELRDALASLPIRAAVEAGEVLVGEDGRVISGGALTTSRRVKEGAREGEILLGPSAAAQSAGAAWTEPSEGGHRLVELVEGAPAIARRPDAPLVGRRAELERLVLAVRESAAASACRRVVVLGEPGIGKTRLAVELSHVLWEETLVLTGRCVPYAEGATYLPFAEIVEQMVDGEELAPALHALLDGEPDGDQAATRLVDALSGAAAVDSGDVFWATRKLLETLARDRPLLIILEDVHWAEPTFLDLLEYLVGWSTGARIALVCLARTELLDVRPAWAADALVLRPLGDEETAELLDALPESLALDAEARAAVVAVAEGNPLFLEQLAAHALDGPRVEGRVPASLESLLASRLDALPPTERAVLERAAIVGREFTRGAVDALADDAGIGAATSLLALVRRRLVRPDTATAADDAFLFDHALIQDATYAAVSKSERARLHEQLARWLDGRGGLDEIVGHHLEQAVVNRRSAGLEGDLLADEASDRLSRAGGLAAWAHDNHAAAALLDRAIELRPRLDPRRLELECELSITLKNLWEWRRALALLDDVAQRAVELGSRRLELRAQVEQVWPHVVAREVDTEAMLRTLGDAVRECEADGDLFGLARAWLTQATVEGRLCGRYDSAVAAAQRAAECFELLGKPGAADPILAGYVVDGPMPVDDAIALCEGFLAAGGRSRNTEAFLLTGLAWLRGWRGDSGAALALIQDGHNRYREVGNAIAISTTIASTEANLLLLLDRDTEVVRTLATRGLAEAKQREDGPWMTHFLGLLATVAVMEGSFRGAIALTDEARAVATDGDVFHALEWRSPRVRALAALEQFEEAEAIARGTIDVVDATDCLYAHGQARAVLAEVLAAVGRHEQAAETAAEASLSFERKGATLLAEQTRGQAARYRRGEPDARAPLARA